MKYMLVHCSNKEVLVNVSTVKYITVSKYGGDTKLCFIDNDVEDADEPIEYFKKELLGETE